MVSNNNSESGPQISNLKDFKSEALFGAEIVRLLAKEQLPAVGFGRVSIARGSTLEPHIHEASESFILILEGSATVVLDGANRRVTTGDTVYIPAGVSHGFSTPDEAVVFLSVQSPPIYPDDSTPDIKFGG